MVLINGRWCPKKHPNRDTLSSGKKGYAARAAWERRVGYRYWKPIHLWWITNRPRLFSCFRTEKSCLVRGDSL